MVGNKICRSRFGGVGIERVIGMVCAAEIGVSEYLDATRWVNVHDHAFVASARQIFAYAKNGIFMALARVSHEASGL